MDFTDGPYYNFKRSQIIAPGVRMIPAPGHTYGNSIVIAEDGGLFYMFHGDITYTDEAMYADKLSIVYDDIFLARSTQNTIREFIRNHPTVYCGTHTPLGYENLEAKRVMGPVMTILSGKRGQENTFAPSAAMCMTPLSTTAWPLRTCRRTGYARAARRARISSIKHKGEMGTVPMSFGV